VRKCNLLVGRMREMARNMGALAAAGALLGALFAGDAAFAQRSGGVLKVYFFDSPASMSIHEEATIAGQGPAMGVFNNLVMYNQDVPAKRSTIDRTRPR
jgi:peptide/nickel transport system substrate-binding protein